MLNLTFVMESAGHELSSKYYCISVQLLWRNQCRIQYIWIFRRKTRIWLNKVFINPDNNNNYLYKFTSEIKFASKELSNKYYFISTELLLRI